MHLSFEGKRTHLMSMMMMMVVINDDDLVALFEVKKKEQRRERFPVSFTESRRSVTAPLSRARALGDAKSSSGSLLCTSKHFFSPKIETSLVAHAKHFRKPLSNSSRFKFLPINTIRFNFFSPSFHRVSLGPKFICSWTP